MPDLLLSSPDTWRDRALDPPVIAPDLVPHPDAPILVLVEPTSAVDAHTEARIAERVAEHRRGRTTVVATVSPLWLHHADEVVLLHDGRIIAAGTHQHLLEDSDDYRRVVARALDETQWEPSHA